MATFFLLRDFFALEAIIGFHFQVVARLSTTSSCLQTSRATTSSLRRGNELRVLIILSVPLLSPLRGPLLYSPPRGPGSSKEVPLPFEIFLPQRIGRARKVVIPQSPPSLQGAFTAQSFPGILRHPSRQLKDCIPL